MTTLMSSGFLCKARAKSSGFSQRVIRRRSHCRSARASRLAALYQCRLLALTLPRLLGFDRDRFHRLTSTSKK